MERIDGRRPALLFRFKSGNKIKGVCCETLYADDTYLRNRRHPILVGKIDKGSSADNLTAGGISVVTTDKTKFCNDITKESLKEDVAICVQYSEKEAENFEVTDPTTKIKITAIKITPGNELAFMNAWYRRQLGIKNRIGKRIPLMVILPKSRRQAIWWQLRACARHPQIAVVMSTVLAVVGTGLGVVGFAAVLKETPWIHENPKLDWVWLSIAALGFLISLVGFWPLYLRAKLTPLNANQK